MSKRKVTNTLGEFLKTTHPASSEALQSAEVVQVSEPAKRDSKGRFLPKEPVPVKTGTMSVIQVTDKVEGKQAAVEIGGRNGDIIRYKYIGGKFNPKTQFLPFSVSNTLQRLLKGIAWIDVTTPSVATLEDIVTNGWSHPDILGGTKMKCLFGYLKDMKGKAILIPADSKINGIKDIGCHTHMSGLQQAMKAGKYINRHYAPLQIGEEYILGFEQADGFDKETGEAVIELAGGNQIIVKYVDIDDMSPEQKANCDGHIDFNQHFVNVMKEFGTKVKHGQSWTITSQRGMGKGHSRFVKKLDVDLVIYGPKAIYTTNDFQFGIRADLHPGKPHTDMQSAINFQFDRPSMMPALNKDWLGYVFDSAHNERMLRKAFLGNVNLEDQDDDTWSLLKWMRKGVSPFCGQAWLYRKIVRHLLEKTMKVSEGRVPMEYAPGKGVAISRYVAGDIFAVQENGTINMAKSIIPEGFCVCMDLPKDIEVVIYRQPNENQNAHYLLKNMHHPAYEFAKGGPYIYLGHGQFEVAARLGGMDNDDSLIIVHDPTWVQGFKDLDASPYPEYGPLKPVKVKPMADDGDESGLSFYDRLIHNQLEGIDVEQYGLVHTIHQIEASKSARAGIGPVANLIMVDTALSIPRYKQYIAQRLAKRFANNENESQTFLGYLANRRDYQASKFATHLELIIDGNVKDPELLAALGDVPHQLNTFHKESIMYPRSMAKRVPKGKKDKKAYILVDTPLCRALELMRDDVDSLIEAFKTNEWLLVRQAEVELLRVYPPTPMITKLVHGVVDADNQEIEQGILGIWRAGWKEAFESGIADDDQLMNVRKNIIDQVQAKVKGYEPEMKDIAVELYRVYYQGLNNTQSSRDATTGKRRSYPDGLLGLDLFNLPLLEAFTENGMTGEIYPVTFDRYMSTLKQLEMNVHVESGIVFRTVDHSVLGMTKAPNGDYPMVAGLIETKKAHSCLRAADDMYSLPKNIEEASTTQLPGENG